MIATPSRFYLPMQSKGRILLVEDEEANMFLLSTYLRDAGFIVDEAADGAQALERLLHYPNYTLVVTDRIMPNMDGMELFRRIKQNQALAHIPVIMQTGANAPQEIVDGIKAGVYYYLTKPYQETTLLTLIHSAIRDNQQQQEFFQRLSEQKEALNTFRQGEFHVRTPAQAEDIALLLSGMFQRPDLVISGLYELILNGIEHGNLGIGLDKKRKLLADGTWQQEVERLLAMDEHKNKKVKVAFSRADGEIRMTITDDGEGFDWRPYLEIEPARATQSNGRGIAKANLLSFDSLTFKDKGNQVYLTAKSVQ